MLCVPLEALLEPQTMKTTIMVAFAVGMLVLLVGMPVWAQQYGGYQPYGYQPAPGAVPYAAPMPGPADNPVFLRLQPRPRLYRQWNQYNRALDQEVLMRSPLDPESDLQYMLRTF